MDISARAPGDLDDLIACPKCDALHRDPKLGSGTRALCTRCHAVLAISQDGAIARIVALAMTATILIVAAMMFPFLDLKASGFDNKASILDAVLAFSSGLMLPLSLGVAALIIGIPMLRACAILYTLVPLMRRRPPYAHAHAAFRLAQSLRPWSMAEVFIVGVSVALVKVAGLATISIGPAFWAFSALVVVSVLQDSAMSSYSIWERLDHGK